MTRRSNFCMRRNRGYKLHWAAVNKILRAINIYNSRQRLRYYYYKSFSFQKLRGEFKIQCRNLSRSNVEKPLQSRTGKNYIYARKSDVKCTIITSKLIIIEACQDLNTPLLWLICPYLQLNVIPGMINDLFTTICFM